MQFDIPLEIKQVECHLTWMEQMIPFLESSMLVRSETMENHIRFLEKKNGEYQPNDDEDLTTAENFDESYNEHNPKFPCLFAHRLSKAAILLYLSEFEAAISQIELLEILYDKLEPFHKDAFQYAVDVIKWAIITRKNLTKVDKEPLPVEDAVIFKRRWEDLQKNNKAKACLKYMWGNLGGNLKITEESQLSALKEVVSLDSDYHLWYAEVYRKMLAIRRGYLRGGEGYLQKPCEFEQQMCQEAYYRKPNIYMSIKNMGVLLKETMWGEHQVYWDQNESTYLRSWHLFKEALEIAKERKQASWTTQIQIYLAELLLFGRGRKLDQEEGKRLLDQCLAENPQDAIILRKMGRLCNFGADRTRKYRNCNQAGYYFSQAIKAKPTNYPCVKDYLRWLGYRKNYEEYIRVIDESLKEMKRDYKVASLKILRGCVIWIYNPFKSPFNREEACESWLDVLIKLPEFAQKLFADVRKPKLYELTNINKQELILTLNWLMDDNYSISDMQRFCAIQAFLKEAEMMTNEQRPQSLNYCGRNDLVPEWRRTQ